MSSQDPYWQEESFKDFITKQLLTVSPVDLSSARELFYPKRGLLIQPLMLAYAAESRGDIERLFAKSYLLDYCKDSPEQLFELLTLSPPEHFQDVYALLERFKDQAIQLGRSQLITQLEESESDNMVIRRQANIGLLLMKMGDHDSVWPIFEASPNPSVRTHLIHWLAKQKVSPAELFKQYQSDSRPDVRYSLLLALGEYDKSQLPLDTRQTYTEILLQDYIQDRDSGVHGAIDWLLRQWGEDQELEALEQKLAGEPSSGRNWYVNGQGQSFAIITGGTFQKGPADWEEFFGAYPTYKIDVNRIFAIATKEVDR